MNKRIHTKNDTLEQSKDNADHAVKFARLGAAYAIELAKGGLGENHEAFQRMADGIRVRERGARVDPDSSPCDTQTSWLWLGLAMTAAGALWLSRRAG